MDYGNVHSKQIFTGTVLNTRAHVFTHIYLLHGAESFLRS